MNLTVLGGLHVLHPDFVEENLLLASQHLNLVARKQVQVAYDLPYQSIRLQAAKNLLVSLNELVDVCLAELHHKLLAKLKVESQNFKD